MIYVALDQVIFSMGFSALEQYQLSSGFINRNVAQKEKCYSLCIASKFSYVAAQYTEITFQSNLVLGLIGFMACT